MSETRARLTVDLDDDCVRISSLFGEQLPLRLMPSEAHEIAWQLKALADVASKVRWARVREIEFAAQDGAPED